MSIIGKNIKKLRTVKSLSQSKFADLFGLSRASIGSYEEERAEPKIDKLVDIAKYFSIELESFISKELSVNEISGFKSEVKLVDNGNHNLIKTSDSSSRKIALVKSNTLNSYITSKKLNKSWNKNISLPLNINENTQIAVSQTDNSMYDVNNGISMDDIVYGEETSTKNINNGYIYIIFTKDTILIRKIFIVEGETFNLEAINKNYEPIALEEREIFNIFRITGQTRNTINHFL